tara:strand:- start:337 stop:840 length:504 start_codon:yes stop_codon:yes gene_type:complete
MKKQHNHLVSDIPNNKKNRNFISELNKLARKSNSKYRYRVRYRKPINGYREGYSDGCVPMKDASCFSVYLIDKTPYKQTYEYNMYERHREEIGVYKSEYKLLENKYKNLLQKHNKMILSTIINQLKDDVDDLQYQMDKTNYNDVYKSLQSLSSHLIDDVSDIELDEI